MGRTTVSREDIRDGAVDGSKLSNPISIAQAVTDKIVHSNGGMTTVYDHTGTAAGMLQAGKLLVSGDAGNKSAIPSPAGSAYFAGDVIIKGNMTIEGTNTVIDTQHLAVKDNIIVLNTGADDGIPNTSDAGVEVDRGSLSKVAIRWNESLDVWDLTNNGTSYGRILDQVYADERYMSRTNSSFTGEIITTSAVDDILQLRQNGGGTSYISFYSNVAEPATYVKKAYIGLNASETDLIISTANGPTRVYLNNNTYVNGNISLPDTFTVDGVDVSAHNGNLITNVKHVTDAYLAALAGTSGTPSGTNKYVTDADTRLTNARTPVAHGDTLHNNLSYFNTVCDDQVPQNTKSATTTLRNMQFKGGTNVQVVVGSDGSNAGIVTISGVHNHDGTYVKLTNGSVQTIASDIVIGAVGTPKSLTVNGDLTVAGTTTYLNTTQLNVGDNIISLNNDYTGSSPTENAGIEINRGTLFKPQLVWDETDDIWKLTNDGTNYYRITEENRADARYVNVTGDTMTATLEVSIASGSALRSTTGHADINVLEVNNSNGGNGFDLKYKGAEAGNNKALELWCDNQTGTAQRAYRVHQDGTMTIDKALTLSSAVTMSSGASVTGNITVTGTVDGRDVSADGAKLDPIHTTHSKRNRKTTKLISAIAQDATVTMTALGFTGLSWGATNIVLVIVDGQINAPTYDYTLGATDTIVFLYDIPAGSIIEIIVI